MLPLGFFLVSVVVQVMPSITDGVALTPTQVLSLAHGDGCHTQRIVWPRPEASAPAKARLLQHRRMLAVGHTPSARSYQWPPGSKGESMGPVLRSPTRPASAPASPRHLGAMPVVEGTPAAVFISPSTMMPEPIRCETNGILKQAALSRQASHTASREALASIDRIAWPSKDVQLRLDALVRPLIERAAELQVSCAAVELAAVQAQRAVGMAAEGHVKSAEISRRELRLQRVVADNVWQSELRDMELGQHIMLQTTRNYWQREASRLSRKVDFERGVLRNATAGHASQMCKLQSEVSRLEGELAVVTAKRRIAMDDHALQAHLPCSSANIDRHQKLKPMRGIADSTTSMMDMSHALASATVSELCAHM